MQTRYILNSLDVDLINSTSPYHINKVSDCRYQFVTGNNTLYHLVFDEDEMIGGVPTYQFSIVNITGTSPVNDGRVKDVIMSVLCNFFDLNDLVVLYICDTSDGRQSVRARLFKQWFKEFDRDGNLMILSDSLTDEGIVNEFGIVFKRNNPKANNVISDFNYMTEAFRESK